MFKVFFTTNNYDIRGMKKLTIEVTDETHNELLKVQLEKRLKGDKKTLAQVAADVLEETLVKQEKPAK